MSEAELNGPRGSVTYWQEVNANTSLAVSGVSSSISIAQSGSAQRIKVGVDIAHTFIGDLRVELVSPSGQQALLHDRFGGGEDNLIRSYDSLSHPALAALTDQPIQGNWELRVRDLAGRDVGKFNKWSLELSL